MLNIPILLICFNRPEHTRKVLERILEAQPKDLYVFQDGARNDNENDARKCAEVRQMINDLTKESGVHLHAFNSDRNLGCGAGPMTGINWFFENVEQGIVMEDDCLAHPDFFDYCEELLDRYKGTSVKFINSTLYDDRWSNLCSDSYGYSHYMVTGAWASYREVWQGFDLNLKNLNAFKFAWHVYKLTQNFAEAEWWWYQVRAIQKDNSKKSYWDYQMQIHLFRKDALTIHPAVNLISNIGFDAEGTHTMTNDGRGDRSVSPIYPLRHPLKISVDKKKDMYCWAKKKSKGLLLDLVYAIYHLYSWRDKTSKVS